MKIKVEQRHIDAGAPKCPTSCMVALALDEAATPDYLMVDGRSFDIGFGDSFRTYNFPDHVAAAIDKFDDGQPVEPFEFEIELQD